MRRIAPLILLTGLAGGAQAYQPEAGLWWNPAESGSGFTIEIQDNSLAFTGYLGEANGAPVWYTAAGFMTGNAVFEGPLLRFTGSQCAGCAYPGPPSAQTVGSLRLVFDANDPTRGTLTWNVPPRPIRSMPIERFYYYLKRPEDGAAPQDVTKLLGEWHLTLDFSEVPNFNAFRYGADVLVFDEFSREGGTWYFDGCRAETSLDGFCTNDALRFNSASGFYSEARRRQSIVVDDNSVDSAGRLLCMYYEARVQAEHFTAGLSGVNDGGFTIFPCNQNPLNFTLYPLRGFRTASRTFVEEGVGPSKRAASAGIDHAPGLREAAPLKDAALRKSEQSEPGFAEFEREVMALTERVLGKR